MAAYKDIQVSGDSWFHALGARIRNWKLGASSKQIQLVVSGRFRTCAEAAAHVILLVFENIFPTNTCKCW